MPGTVFRGLSHPVLVVIWKNGYSYSPHVTDEETESR